MAEIRVLNVAGFSNSISSLKPKQNTRSTTSQPSRDAEDLCMISVDQLDDFLSFHFQDLLSVKELMKTDRVNSWSKSKQWPLSKLIPGLRVFGVLWRAYWVVVVVVVVDNLLLLLLLLLLLFWFLLLLLLLLLSLLLLYLLWMLWIVSI